MKILYFYPENPILFTQGNNARALSLLQYFKDRNIEVDFIGEKSKVFKEDSINEMKSRGLITNGFLLKRIKKKNNYLKYLFTNLLPKKINRSVKDFDRTKFGHKEQFLKIINSEKYDFKIISYAYWASLLENSVKSENEKWIIDTHDFLTSQFQYNKRFALDKYFKTEINLLKKFDRIWVISNEEKYLFSQFTNRDLDYITHSLPSNIAASLESNKTIDIVYVASENEHNIKSANWFFEKVYPTLPENIKITVVGQINNYIPEFKNVNKVLFVEDLDEIYKKSKIAICPMLSGTGVKIKVIEALSYGLPVVCTEKGVDGLLNKTNNGCLSSNDYLRFSGYICELLENSEFYQKIHVKAKTFFDENFEVNKTYKVLDSIFFNKINE